jgi:hypothetical protein
VPEEARQQSTGGFPVFQPAAYKGSTTCPPDLRSQDNSSEPLAAARPCS